MNLTVADLDRVQAKLDGDYRVELVNGDIVVMSSLAHLPETPIEPRYCTQTSEAWASDNSKSGSR